MPLALVVRVGNYLVPLTVYDGWVLLALDVGGRNFPVLLATRGGILPVLLGDYVGTLMLLGDCVVYFSRSSSSRWRSSNS